MVYTPHQILFGLSNQEECDGRGLWQVLERKDFGFRFEEKEKRHRRRWQGNIKMNLAEMRGDGVDWIYQSQDRDKWRALVNAVINLRVP